MSIVAEDRARASLDLARELEEKLRRELQLAEEVTAGLRERVDKLEAEVAPLRQFAMRHRLLYKMVAYVLSTKSKT